MQIKQKIQKVAQSVVGYASRFMRFLTKHACPFCGSENCSICEDIVHDHARSPAQDYSGVISISVKAYFRCDDCQGKFFDML